MHGERFIPAFLIKKKDLSAKQNFNGEGQKPAFLTQSSFLDLFSAN